MSPRRSQIGLAAVVGAWALVCSAVLAVEKAAAPAAESASRTIAIDANLGDWPEGKRIAADDRFIYVRLLTESPITPQANEYPLVLRIDLDGNPQTGRRATWRADEPMGVDLEVQFSPPKSPSRSRNRGRKDPRDEMALRIAVFDGESESIELAPGDVDFMIAPSYLADDFELRLSRELAEKVTGIRIGPELRASFVALPKPSQAESLATLELDVPAATGGLDHAQATLPAREKDSVRVISYNMLREATVSKAPAFGRLLRAIGPDVFLLQEWPRGKGATEGWFRENVDRDVKWHVIAKDDVTVVSRFALTSLFAGNGPDEPRVLGVRVATPGGPLLVASMHLKCCGGAAGREEEKRMDEARWINERLQDSNRKERLPMVIGGDLNLVGTVRPREVLRQGVDGGQDLKVADGLTLGDTAFYTWRDYAYFYSPHRIDWLLYSGTSLEPTSCFVLDPGRLPEKELERIQVRRDDGLASDHLPLVLDVRFLNPAAQGETAAQAP